MTDSAPYTMKNGVYPVDQSGVVLKLHNIDGNSSSQHPGFFSIGLMSRGFIPDSTWEFVLSTCPLFWDVRLMQCQAGYSYLHKIEQMYSPFLVCARDEELKATHDKESLSQGSMEPWDVHDFQQGDQRLQEEAEVRDADISWPCLRLWYEHEVSRVLQRAWQEEKGEEDPDVG
jgi:hypothetical protein